MVPRRGQRRGWEGRTDGSTSKASILRGEFAHFEKRQISSIIISSIVISSSHDEAEWSLGGVSGAVWSPKWFLGRGQRSGWEPRVVPRRGTSGP